MAGEIMSAYVRFFVKDDVSSDAKNVEQRAKDASKGMDDAAKVGGNSFSSSLAKVGSAAKTGAVAIAGVTSAAVAVVGALIGIASACEETIEDMGKLETAFKVTGWSSEDAQNTYKDFVGILGETDQAVEASNHLAELCNNEEELASWGTIAAGVYAKFGDSLPIEGLTEAANETAKVGEVTGPLADALNWAGKSEDEFNEALAACNSEAERSALITSTLNEIYSEAGNVYKETNADLIASREAQATFNAALAEAGRAALPVKTAILQIGASIMTAVLPYIQQISGWITANLPAIQQVIVYVATKLIAIAPILAGIGAAIGIVVAAINVWKAVTNAMKVAQLLLNAVMLANPLVLIAALVAGVVAAIVLLWNTNEGFRNAIVGSWNAVLSAIKGVVGGIKSAFTGLASVASSVWNGITTTIGNAINGAKNIVETAINAIKGIFNFEWSLPKLALPHISVSGGEPPYGIAGLGKLPSFSIDWYAKGAIFDAATLLPTSTGFAGVGEAGPEAVAPIGELLGMMKEAIASMNVGANYVANVNVTTGETDESKLARMIAREQRKQAYALGAL